MRVSLHRRGQLLFASLSIGVMATLGYAAPSRQSRGDRSALTRQLGRVRKNLRDTEIRIKKCEAAGYDRQVRYWRLRRELWLEQQERLTLREQISEAEREGKEPQKDARERLLELNRMAEARRPRNAQDRRASAIWMQAKEAQQALDEPYGWHEVKLALLRELIHRARRIEFYTQEAMGPLGAKERRRRLKLLSRVDAATEPTADRSADSLHAELDSLLCDGRTWENDYGELFFRWREQRLMGRYRDAPKALEMAKALEGKLSLLGKRREALTEKVLASLTPFDRDGKFSSLGVPSVRPIRIDADGRPSDLIYCGEGGGGVMGAALRASRNPLCFDVLDFRFRVPSFKAPGQIDTEERGLKRRLGTVGTDAASGYAFKQPVHVIAHAKTPKLIDPRQLPAHAEDQDLFLRSYDGQYGTYPNIWSPEIRELARTNLVALGGFCKENVPNLLLYDKITWEPAFHADRPSKTEVRLAGYNPDAIEAFRRFLRRTFGTIERLNASWRSDYPGFDAIEPPPDPFVEPRTWATPLTHEFERFRVDAYADWLTMCIKALQDADPGRPIAAQVAVINAHFPWAMADPFALIKRIPAQYIEDHYNNWSGAYPNLNMLYSLCLYAGKHPIEMEYIWTYPRLQKPETEDQFRVTGELGFWRRIVWGRKALHVFGWFNGWGYNHNYMDERFCELGATLGPTGYFVREAATCLPVSKKRAREFWPILNSTEVVEPRIACLLPTTTVLNQYPYCSPYRGYGASVTEIIRFERQFMARDLDYRVVPEAVVLSGQEDMSGFRVIVLPYAPYFPNGLTEKLLAWTKRGGLLICAGAAGLFDKYGFDDGSLMHALFGTGLKAGYAGEGLRWRWQFAVAPDGRGVKVLGHDDRGPVLLSAKYGDGVALLSAQSIAGTGMETSAKMVIDRIERAIGWPTASSASRRVEMVTREDPQGRRYLFVANPNLSETATDFVTVDGEYRRVVDLGIGSHCQVPLAPRDTDEVAVTSPPNRTTFQLRLAPGEATAMRLGK